MKNNNNLVIKKIAKIYDNLIDMKNTLVEEYTNIHSIEIFNQLLSECYDLIIAIHKDIFLSINSNCHTNDLQKIRTNINKINYIIRYILIYQYIHQNKHCDDINYNLFDEQFLISKEFYNYVSNDTTEIEDIKKKLINYCLVNDKFKLTFKTFDINSLTDDFDIYCSIKYVLQIFLNNEEIILKLIAYLKSNKKNIFDSYLTKKKKLYQQQLHQLLIHLPQLHQLLIHQPQLYQPQLYQPQLQLI